MKKIIVFVVAVLAIGYFLFWSNKSIMTTKYSIKIKDLPKAFEGERIVNVSDLQSQYFGKNQSNLIDKVKAAKPNYIIITGDLVDRNHTDYDAALTTIRKLVKIAPVYYINGNHEVALPISDINEMYDQMDRLGVNRIFDKLVELRKGNSRIYLAGISEETLYAAKEQDDSIISDKVNELVKSSRVEDVVLMLAHEPQYLEHYANEKVDVIFAGHAHGGQIRLPFTEGLFAPGQGTMPKLTNGIHHCGSSRMIISRGLGNSVFPFRIFNRPEIVVVTLHSK